MRIALKIFALAAMSVLLALAGFRETAHSQSDSRYRAKALSDALAAADSGDYASAASLLQPIADQEDAVALNLLGGLYLAGGKGLQQDQVKAIALFRRAAEKGNGSSQRHLAIAYEKGQGVPVDPAMARTWYLKAANRGDALAQLAVGKQCASGQGMPQDYVQAYKWFTLASSGSFTDSEKAKREEALANRAAIAAKMTPSQISDAQGQVRSWSAR